MDLKNTSEPIGVVGAGSFGTAIANLLAENKSPSREEIVNHMSTNLCRCGTYPTIVKAIQLASREV